MLRFLGILLSTCQANFLQNYTYTDSELPKGAIKQIKITNPSEHYLNYNLTKTVMTRLPFLNSLNGNIAQEFQGKWS